MIISKRLGIATCVAIAILGSYSGFARAAGAEPAFMQKLFSPELVMQNQRAIGLEAGQRKRITQAIRKTQSDTVELQWSVQEAAGALEAEVENDPIDEKKAIAAAAHMMEIEIQVKRAHLGLLIQIRNTLHPQQREKLRKIRDAARAGR